MMDDPSYFEERRCERCGDEAIGMSGLCHLCHESAEARVQRWQRADPGALAAFDPATKTCVMNCGPHIDDPRSALERLFLCDDCDTTPSASQTRNPERLRSP